MRIQLINPPPFRRTERFHDIPDYTRLSLACLASYLRERGLTCNLIDCKFEQLDSRTTLKRVAEFQPEVVGLTAFTNEVKSAARIANMIRQSDPKVVLVLGGVHISALPEQSMQEFSVFDYGVIGEGELPLWALLQALEVGDLDRLKNINGLVWRQNQAINVNLPLSPLEDLDHFPNPAWDLLPPSPEYLIMTQKGCPFNCPFCMNPNGRKVRYRSVERVIEEIKQLQVRPGCERLMFCDEVFGIDQKRTDDLLNAMISSGINSRVKSFAQTHVSFASVTLFKKMKAAGFYGVGLGFETGDPEWMKDLGKGLRIEKVHAARDAARQAGLPIEGYFILGLPNECRRSALKTISLAVRLNVDLPVFGLMVPYPGTKVAQMAFHGEGGYRLKSKDWNDYNKQLGDALEFEHLSRNQLEWLQLIGYLSVFIFNGRLTDLARFVWQFRREGIALVKKLLIPRANR